MFLATGVATLAGAPLAWDGAYYLFKLLDRQRPFMPHERAIDQVLQALPLLLSQVTSDLGWLRFTFSLVYASVGPLSLLVTWLLLRRRAPEAFVWPALAICLGLLPGQMLFVGEGLVVSQLFWPLLASLVGAPSPWRLGLAVLLGVAIYVAHPTAVVLLGFCAGYAAWCARHDYQPRMRWARWIVALGLAILAVVRVFAARSGYENESLSVQVLINSFQVAIVGWPLASLVCTGAAAVAVATAVVPGVPPRWCSRLTWSAVGAALLSGVVLLPWAARHAQWAHALDFRFWQSPITLGFAVLFILDRKVLRSGLAPRAAPSLAGRVWLVRAAAVSYAAVLVLQSVAWARLVGHLIDDVRASGAPCLPALTIARLPGTPLDHWATAPLVIVLQSRAPTTLVLDGNACTAYLADGTVAFADWDVRPPGSGWFSLEPRR